MTRHHPRPPSQTKSTPDNNVLPPPVFVQTTDHLRRVVDILERETLIAVDTESNSLYAYRERVCLIQISTPANGSGKDVVDYIIDPLAIKDMTPLAPIFASSSLEKVFHAATYDLMTLKRDFGFEFRGLFDTMIAARICGLKTIGLNNLLGEIVGVQLDKSHQRDDWGKRPLPKASLLYAQMDTHYLPQLRDHFHERLNEHGRHREAKEAFAEVADVPAAVDRQFDTEAFWKLGAPNHLKPRQFAVLREIYALREEFARDYDLPSFKIIMDKTLVAIAHAMPASLTEFEGIQGMTPGQIRRYGRDLLEAVERGRAAPIPKPPPTEPPADPRTVEVYTALREWRKAKAAARDVEADVIISRDALWNLAEQMPTTMEDVGKIPGIGEWRLEAYGEELLALLETLKK
jgi:ribonuclease D